MVAKYGKTVFSYVITTPTEMKLRMYHTLMKKGHILQKVRLKQGVGFINTNFCIKCTKWCKYTNCINHDVASTVV